VQFPVATNFGNAWRSALGPMDHCHASDVRSLLNSASRLTLNWRAKSLIAVDGERKSWPAVAGYDEREPTGAASRNGAKNGATGSAVPDADHRPIVPSAGGRRPTTHGGVEQSRTAAVGGICATDPVDVVTERDGNRDFVRIVVTPRKCAGCYHLL
jgi:hypothetical protein